MTKPLRNLVRGMFLAGLAILALGSGGTVAEPRPVRLAKQFGISYLPLTLMEEKKLLEEHGRRLGLGLKTDAIWVKAEGSKMSPDAAEKLIRAPENEWTTTPNKVMAYAEFMSRTGLLPVKPADWQELLFENIHALPRT